MEELLEPDPLPHCFPYVINKNVRKAYATSEVMKNAVSEQPRKIRADDFQWEKEITPAPLRHYAALELSRIFHRIDPLNVVLRQDRDMLMDLYPADIPLKFSVPLIKDERYWQRCFETVFPRKKELDVKYWKGKYLSACLQDYLEHVNPDVFNEKEAVELATLVSPYIYFLHLDELIMVRQPTPALHDDEIIEDTCVYSVPKVYDHLPLEPILAKLYNLQEIAIVFAKNNIEDHYNPRYFEFSLQDCENLCRGLENLHHLKIVRINRTNLCSSKAKYILERLVTKESIEELDFNHCAIGDYGMKALGGFISIHPGLRVVRVANNRFKEAGVQGIAYALQMNPAAPIELIDFRLNQMSLECATIFAAAFVRCKTKPQTLIVNSCGFHGESAVKMAGLLSLNRGLTRLDMASNDLSGEPEQVLIKALTQNRTILKIDLRKTKISEETEAKVRELLARNYKLVGQEREPSEEIPPLYLDEPEYLVWEYNPNNPDHWPGRYPDRVAEV